MKGTFYDGTLVSSCASFLMFFKDVISIYIRSLKLSVLFISMSRWDTTQNKAEGGIGDMDGGG
jgi:hypothetical protein